MNKNTLRRNIFTRPLRLTTLTIAASALPRFVYPISRSFVDILNQFFKDSDRNMRVAVHQKLTFTRTLPQRMREEISTLAPPGYIEAICRATWFGGRIKNSQSMFPSMAMDRDTFPIVYSEFHLTPKQIENFQKERRGAIVAKNLADSMNWQEGTKVTLTGTLPPFAELEFIIVAIGPDIKDNWFYFGLDYYNEVIEKLTNEPVGIHNFWMKCNSPEARQWALAEIDKHFANTNFETRTEMESTFIASFINSQGDIFGMIWTIGRLIVFVAIAVAFNTMSMAFRERTREIAVLRALGFHAGSVTRILLIEGLVLGLIGGTIATLPIYAITHLIHIQPPNMPPILIEGKTAAFGLGVAVLCGLLAATIPALMARRLQIAPALRKVA